MTQKLAFVLSAALTAFLLVSAAALAIGLAWQSASAAPADTGAASAAAPGMDPTLQAIIAQRDQAYQQALQQANQQLQQAYAQEKALADQLAKQQGNASVTSASAAAITPQAAADLAQKAAGSATLLRLPDLVSYQGKIAYEAQFNSGAVYVDANSGAILYNGLANSAASANQTLTQDQAVQVAVAYMGGGTPVGLKLGHDNGALLYDVVFDDGNQVVVNATTGQVIASTRQSQGSGEGGGG